MKNNLKAVRRYKKKIKMQIRDEIIQALKEDHMMQAFVAQRTNRKPAAVKYWADNKTDALLQLPTLEAICTYTKLPITDVVDQFPATEFQVKPVKEAA